jgi:hypothetical protein
MSTQVPHIQRPWTVKALVAWAVIATGLTLVLEGSLLGADIAGIAFAALTAWALWNGKSWMYVLSYAGFALMAVVLVFTTFDDDRMSLVRGWVTVIVGFYLLVHPATRAFAQTERQTIPATPRTNTDGDPVETVGVRRNTIIALVFLLAAIALAGTLGVIRMYQMGN